MSSFTPDFNSASAAQAMYDGLIGAIKDHLRNKILKEIEPSID